LPKTRPKAAAYGCVLTSTENRRAGKGERTKKEAKVEKKEVAW